MEGVKWEKGARDVGSICLRSWFIRFGCGLSALWKCKMVKESEGGGGEVGGGAAGESWHGSKSPPPPPHFHLLHSSYPPVDRDVLLLTHTWRPSPGVSEEVNKRRRQNVGTMMSAWSPRLYDPGERGEERGCSLLPFLTWHGLFIQCQRRVKRSEQQTLPSVWQPAKC